MSLILGFLFYIIEAEIESFFQENEEIYVILLLYLTKIN